MTKTYASLFAAGVLALSGLAYAGTAQNILPAAVNTVEDDEELPPLKPYGPQLDLYFDIEDDHGFVAGTIYAPTQLMGDWQTNRPDADIEGTMTIRLVKSCHDLDVKDELVEEWTDVEPDQKIEFTDNDVIIGQSWSYRAIAIIGEAQSDEWYGTMGAYTGIRPLAVENYSVSSEGAHAPVTVTFTVPDGVMDADMFPDITYAPERVFVTRKYTPVGEYNATEPVLVWEQANPVCGEPYTFEDDNNGEDMPEGTYAYSVVVSWMWGESYEMEKRTGLYFDSPAAPETASATVIEEGVKVTWSPVTKAYGIGYLDPESVLYDVYRYFGYNDTELVGEDIKETEFIDDLKGIDKQMDIQYQVIAKNDKGFDSWGKQTNHVIVGPAATLPFVEDFTGTNSWGQEGAPAMLWTSTTLSGMAEWNSGAKASYYDASWNQFTIEPTEPSKGLAYTGFASWCPDGTIAYTSGSINFEGHDAGELTLGYYAAPGGVIKLDVEIMSEIPENEGSDDPVSPYAPYAVDEPKTAVIWSGTNNAEEAGWKEETVTFDGFGDYAEVYIRIKATCDGLPEDGIIIPAAVQYVKLDSSDNTDSVEAIGSETAVSSEYYSLQGIRMAAPVKGQTVIRRSVMSDGSVRTSKVIVK